MRQLTSFILLTVLCSLAGCTEQRTVSRSSSYSGLSPIPTRTSEPKGAPANANGGNGDDVFDDMGHGISSLFDEKGDKNNGGWQIITPLGQKIKLSPGYSGQSVFRTREGPAFRLTFKDGALVMIENETTPAVGRLKPGTLGAPGMPGVPVPPPASGAPGAPGAPKPPAVDEGDVPQPVGRPPATSDE